jgi:hypothetical protein
MAGLRAGYRLSVDGKEIAERQVVLLALSEEHCLVSFVSINASR